MREFALDLAQRAGELLLDFQRRGRSGMLRTKSTHMDIVTEADLASEQFIVQAIHAQYPEHAIQAEESAASRLPDAEWIWFVDPVDGTTNYAHGLPIFAVNLGLAHWRVPVLGVTHAPALGYTYWAEDGQGAWLRHDGGFERLRVSDTDRLERAMLTTGFPYDRATAIDNNLEQFARLDHRSQAVRRLGSAAMDLAWVAEGALDAYWESRAHDWDWVAGVVLVREAGGQVTDFAGRQWEPGMDQILAVNGQAGLHSIILSTIQGDGDVH
jgi:myo-inositol-1(or 4)-monophosphatase